MKTSSFLAALRASADLPVVFGAGRNVVAPGYHLTEVKRVSYETMDCGALTHRWSESQFELWTPANAGDAADRGHMPAAKFIQIVDRVEAELPLKADAIARIHTSFAGQPAALYDIGAVTARDGQLWVELIPDKTRCKAAERRAAVGLEGCGCCGVDAEPAQENAAGSACGCGAGKNESAAATCCA
jgi:hypothetical protein